MNIFSIVLGNENVGVQAVDGGLTPSLPLPLHTKGGCTDFDTPVIWETLYDGVLQ